MRSFTISVKLSFTLLLCGVFFAASAKIWRVNNIPGVNADFTTLQAAHNGAASGDTIHLEGSPTSYGNLTASKKLAIIGPGFFLSENPNTQAVALTALVGSVSFNIGAEGSIIMGCDFNAGSCQVFCDNIVIRRNKFSQRSGNSIDWSVGIIYLQYQSNNGNLPVNNVIISQNFGLIIEASGRAHTGVLISNNYIGHYGYSGDASTGNCINMNANSVVILQNNIFRRGTVNVSNSNLSNNIMVAGFLGGSGNLTSNNIANGTQFGNANGNQQNVDMATVFVGAGSGISSDGAWKLKAGSPAIGAGFGSTVSNPIDCGMYGGYFPYALSGMPPIPSIYFFENQPVGSNADPIDVSIKVKSNN
jgi:hypothetical protein